MCNGRVTSGLYRTIDDTTPPLAWEMALINEPPPGQLPNVLPDFNFLGCRDRFGAPGVPLYAVIIARCPLPTAHCPLPTAHCPLPTAHCPLPTAHRSPLIAYRSLLTAMLITHYLNHCVYSTAPRTATSLLQVRHITEGEELYVCYGPSYTRTNYTTSCSQFELMGRWTSVQTLLLHPFRASRPPVFDRKIKVW
jgi:hypothetical protein